MLVHHTHLKKLILVGLLPKPKPLFMGLCVWFFPPHNLNPSFLYEKKPCNATKILNSWQIIDTFFFFFRITFTSVEKYKQNKHV